MFILAHRFRRVSTPDTYPAESAQASRVQSARHRSAEGVGTVLLGHDRVQPEAAMHVPHAADSAARFCPRQTSARAQPRRWPFGSRGAGSRFGRHERIESGGSQPPPGSKGEQEARKAKGNGSNGSARPKHEHSEPKTFFQRVNTRALERIELWAKC